MLARIGSRLAIAVLASLALIVPSASASEIWLIAGVPVLNQDPQWHGIRADAADMWTADAPWRTVAHNTRVVLFPPGVVLRAKDDDVLKQAFSDLKRRNIALALEMGLLTQTDSCRYRGEGYLDSVQTVKNALERIRRNGGELSYIAMDEPFYYAHQYSGPNACHEPTTEIARRVAATVAIARSIFPNVRIGDEEVVDASRPATDELAEWADAYRAAVGEPLSFIHADVAWSGLAMRNLKPLAAALKARQVALGIIYNAEAEARSDDAFAQSATEHFVEIEQVLGVHPDHAVFQSWVHTPTRMMPENQPGTLTNLALRYLQPIPSLSLTREGTGIAGRLSDSHGQPISGAEMTIEAIDIAGRMAPADRQLTGTVPKDAAQAMIGIRANAESSCVCAGDTNATVGMIRYSETGTGRKEDIAPGAPPIPRSVKLTPSQTIIWNLKQIPVTAGASYTLSAPIAAAANAESAGYVTAIFFDRAGKGLGRSMLPFRPTRQQLAKVTTDADGRFKVAIPASIAAAHPELRAYYPGSATARPALGIAAPPATAQPPEIAPLKKVEINAPSSVALKQMMADDDLWVDARSSVGSFLSAEGTFKTFTDGELDTLIKKLKAWNISLALEVGGVKEWCRLGQECFSKQKSWWNRITNHGGEISSFAMDEPRHKVVVDLHLPEDYAVEQVAQFIQAVRAAYPQALVGDIETYPTQPTADHIKWIDRLEQRLQEKGVRGLDFYRLDVNWVVFQTEHKGSWADLKAIEEHCHAKKIKFSLIYWASNFPLEKAAGRLNDKTWYDAIMSQGRAYAATGAVPDQYVIESWISLPKQALPDSADYSYTRSVRDFTRQFVQRAPATK
jgi:hypothetical protein